MVMIKKFILLLLLSISLCAPTFAAYIDKMPIQLKQPNGKVFACFTSGDEFYNWVHDKDGYTIVQNQLTGYYCYAILAGEDLIASKYIVGVTDPKLTDLKPNVKMSSAKILAIRNSVLLNTPTIPPIMSSSVLKSSQPFNNIVVYIRFADQTEFPANQATYTPMFNNTDAGANSLRNYFNEVSYGELDVLSSFYPANNGSAITSYKDIHTRNYYLPNTISKDSGYVECYSDAEKLAREDALVKRAVNFIKNQIPANLTDYNNDGWVDNICFIIRGEIGISRSILWPHQDNIYGTPVLLNGKQVHNYNFHIEDYIANRGVGVLAHEFYHSLDAPDLYHLTDYSVPVGRWDVIANETNPPQHMSAYMKSLYGGWITEIPEITVSGTYTLHPLTASTNNCFKIPLKNSTSEYLILEYRKKEGTFESNLPGSGLLIYRINDIQYKAGNANATGAGGRTDEVYVFRPNGSLCSEGDISNANFSQNTGRTEFHNNSNPSCFTRNGSAGDVYIKNISVAGETISFDVRFCDNENIAFSNTNTLPPLSNVSSTISTSNTVTVKKTDKVTFEAGSSVLINGGFAIEKGGTFVINMNGCGK